MVSPGKGWYLRNSNSGGVADSSFQYGGGNTQPIIGDWNGDGIDTIGTVDSNSNWSLRNTNDSGPRDVGFQYGFSGAKPLTW